jgi:hypothetical protein
MIAWLRSLVAGAAAGALLVVELPLALLVAGASEMIGRLGAVLLARLVDALAVPELAVAPLLLVLVFAPEPTVQAAPIATTRSSVPARCP